MQKHIYKESCLLIDKLAERKREIQYHVLCKCRFSRITDSLAQSEVKLFKRNGERRCPFATMFIRESVQYSTIRIVCFSLLMNENKDKQEGVVSKRRVHFSRITVWYH